MYTLNKIPVLYFTGLSGSGKSTIAQELELFFKKSNINCQVLDGNIIRGSINKDLGFSEKDRTENVRRICEISILLLDNNILPIISTISPLNSIRRTSRKIIGESFIEIFTDASLDECKNRDPKGLYKKASNGEIKDFTGIDSVFEMPENPEISLKTDKMSILESTEKIINFMKEKGFLEFITYEISESPF